MRTRRVQIAIGKCRQMAATTFTLASCIRRCPAYTRTYSPTVVWSLAIVSSYPNVLASGLWNIITSVITLATYVIYYSVLLIILMYYNLIFFKILKITKFQRYKTPLCNHHASPRPGHIPELFVAYV